MDIKKKGFDVMTVKELEDILRNYNKDLVISFGKWDNEEDGYIVNCDVEIEKDEYNNMLDITIK